MVENYILKSKEFPNSALTLRGICKNHTNITEGEDNKKVDIMTGVGSYLVKPRFFKINELKNYEILKDLQLYNEAFHHDDIWISGHLAKQNIDRICISFDNERSFLIIQKTHYFSKLFQK